MMSYQPRTSTQTHAIKIHIYIDHCKNKLVVLTTEWLPWLQTNWRDSGYERFAVVLIFRAAQFILQPQLCTDNLRTSVKESLQMHFIVAVRNYRACNITR